MRIRLELSDLFTTHERKQAYSRRKLWEEVDCELSEAEYKVRAKGSERRTEEHPDLIEDGKIPILERGQMARSRSGVIYEEEEKEDWSDEYR